MPPAAGAARKAHVHITQDQVMAAVRERGGMATLDQVAWDLDVSDTTAERNLEGLVAQGKLLRDDFSDDGHPLRRHDRRYGLAGDEPLLPPAWVDPATPTCLHCERDLTPHKGHWTCMRPACRWYGDSQGDGAPEGGDA